MRGWPAAFSPAEERNLTTATGATPGGAGTRVHTGHVFHIAGAPTAQSAARALVSIPDGALVVSGSGAIAWCGALRDLPEEHAAAPITAHPGAFLLPGFVDAHIHYPQTFSFSAHGGGELLEWLERCTFPSETRLADPEFAALAAKVFCDNRIAAGTTSAMVFGSAFPAAQNALFAETARRGLRIVSGRGIQTQGPESASALITGEDEVVELARAEIEMWHQADAPGSASAKLQVAVVPRFSLSVTPRTLAALGELYDEKRSAGVYFHTHLSENNRPVTGEIDSVKSMYQCERYLDTYDGRFLPGSARGGSSLLGRRSVFAHAVHCDDKELARLAETGSSIAHCPTSQQFLGSGTMPWLRASTLGGNIALGTDIGGGDEWLIPRVAADAYKVHLSEPGAAAVALEPAQLLFLATLAGARALDQENDLGNFDLGKQADFVVVEPQRQPALASALEHGIRSDNEELARNQLLFTLLAGMREPAVAQVYVAGRRVG
jgi:guanine deaminase